MNLPKRRFPFSVAGLSPFASAKTADGDMQLQGGWTHLASASPGMIALLWAIAMLLGVVNTVLFPSNDVRWVSSTLYLSGTSIFAGLAAAWLLRLGSRSTFQLLSTLIP